MGYFWTNKEWQSDIMKHDCKALWYPSRAIIIYKMFLLRREETSPTFYVNVLVHFYQRNFVEDVRNECYNELKKVEKLPSMKDTNVEKLVDFDNDGLCEQIEELCPVLSAALRGSLGMRQTDETKAVRVGIYGSIFKSR